MTNTTPNVPRELLERLALQRKQEGWLEMNTAAAFAAAKELRVLLDAAPSPAGVDGLKRYEVFPYLDDDVANLDICESDDGSFVKYDDAQAIIDGLRGEVEERVDAALAADRTARHKQAQRIGKLEGLLRISSELLTTISAHAGTKPNDWCDTFKREVHDRIDSIDTALSAGKEGE